MMLSLGPSEPPANKPRAALSLSFQSVPFPLLQRFLWYEFALRVHQLSAILLAYALVRHIPSDQVVYIYVAAGLFLAACAIQLPLILYRHKFKTSPAEIRLGKNTIRIVLETRRPLKVEAGQYVNIWMPFISALSALQSHPFTVASWSEQPQKELEIIIDPAQGWTRRLWEFAKPGTARSVAMFSGPHGPALSFEGYGDILVLAQGSGIFSCFPHLRKIMHESAAPSSVIDRVHLVYETQVFCKQAFHMRCSDAHIA